MRRHRAAGHSILELVVGMAVMVPFLLIVGQLLFEAQWTMSGLARETHSTVPDFAVALLRQDIHAARSAGGGLPFWNSLDLDLRLSRGVRVEYGLDGDRLVRRRRQPGESWTERQLMQNVLSWRWREASTGLIELEVTYERAAGPRARSRSGTGWRQGSPTRVVTQRLQIARRGMAGGYRW